MRNHPWIRGSGAALAAVIRVDTRIGFLSDRSHGVGVEPVQPEGGAGYVWRRVFLRTRGHRG